MGSGKGGLSLGGEVFSQESEKKGRKKEDKEEGLSNHHNQNFR